MNSLKFAIQRTAFLVASIMLISTLAACANNSAQVVEATVVEGYTITVSENGTNIVLGSTADGTVGEGYMIAGASWRDPDGGWNGWSGDSCAEPLSSGQQLRLGVVDVAAGDDTIGRKVVVWFECLD